MLSQLSDFVPLPVVVTTKFVALLPTFTNLVLVSVKISGCPSKQQGAEGCTYDGDDLRAILLDYVVDVLSPSASGGVEGMTETSAAQRGLLVILPETESL